ncbi:hypothetical protein [Thermopolyspora flexuosa]|uniref:hypothetical protein n=1 Tax=Thermopolyspora flexuosa TaxID=103836 RepID=UPI0011521BFF|nr:hypothetical protein [Thermopolyspora flexuosa]
MPDLSAPFDNVAAGELGEQRLVRPFRRSRSEVGVRAVRSLAILLPLALAVSCSSGEPSFEDAAAELQKDVQRLESHEFFKNPLLELRILQRGDKDIPCGEGGFRRVMRATANEDRDDDAVDSHLDRAQRLMENVLAQDFGYELALDPGQQDAQEGRFIQGEKKDAGLQVSAYVSPEKPTWRLQIMTACLSG